MENSIYAAYAKNVIRDVIFSRALFIVCTTTNPEELVLTHLLAEVNAER